MVDAAVYCRISQDARGEALGVARQEADCRRLAEGKGWTVAEVYTDNDISAFSGKVRPAYQRMLDDLRAGRVRAVVAWHPDRLHRSPRELEDFVDLIDATKAKVATVTAGDVDLSTPAGRMTARIVGAVARGESEHKSARIRRKALELAQAGKVPGGGLRPYGFERDRVTVREDEAAVVRRLAAATLSGAPMRSLVADLNERGIPTVSGVPWSPTTLRRLLRSGRISGQREHRGQLVADAVWPGIISKADTARLRALLDDATRRTHSGTARTYLLSGLVYCGRPECGARMTSRPTSKGVRRYHCAVDRGGCNRNGIDADGVEATVVADMLDALDGPDLEPEESHPDTDGTAADVERLEGELAELAEMYAAGRLPLREWLTARTGLDERLQVARSSLLGPALPRVLADDDTPLSDRWPAMGFDLKRAVLDAVVRRVTIAPWTTNRGRFDADRVDIAWV